MLKVISKKVNFARKAKVLPENEKKNVLFGSQMNL